MIFDTHIHLNDEEFLKNLDSYLNIALNNNVKYFLVIGTDLNTSKIAIELANKYPFIYASVGIFPMDVYKYDINTLEKEFDLLVKNKKVVCVGEIGLDYHYENDLDKRDIQKAFFIKQIELANKYGLPVSLHIRDSIKDSLDILKEHRVNKKGIAHCYSGSLESAKEFIKLGYKIAFGGTLTFKNARVPKEVCQGISLKDIVLETDAPYLSPEPYRGRFNRPEYINEVAKKVAEIKNVSVEEVEATTLKNSLEILNIKL